MSPGWPDAARRRRSTEFLSWPLYFFAAAAGPGRSSRTRAHHGVDELAEALAPPISDVLTRQVHHARRRQCANWYIAALRAGLRRMSLQPAVLSPTRRSRHASRIAEALSMRVRRQLIYVSRARVYMMLSDSMFFARALPSPR